MKTRTGFVSNSSSSSFIVVWPHDPVDVQDVHDMLFEQPGIYCHEEYLVPKGEDPDVTTQRAAEIVWQDICDQRQETDLAGFIAEQIGAYEEPCELLVLERCGPEPCCPPELAIDWNQPLDEKQLEAYDAWKKLHYAPWDEKYQALCCELDLHKQAEAQMPPHPSHTDCTEDEYYVKMRLWYRDLAELSEPLYAARKEQILRECEGQVVYAFEYGNDAPGLSYNEGTAMEINGVFDRLKYWKFSKH
jgi:hypothetical protein